MDLRTNPSPSPLPFQRARRAMRIRALVGYVESTIAQHQKTDEQSRFLQFPILPAMMSDAHENYRNRACAGRHQRPAAAYARGRNHLAAHISCATASQLSAVLLGPACLAHRHLDATNCDELVRISDHQFKILTRPRLCHRFCADGSFVNMGWRDG